MVDVFQCFHQVTLKYSLQVSYRVKPNQDRRVNVNLTEQIKIWILAFML